MGSEMCIRDRDTDRDGLCDLEDVCAGADDTLDYDDNDVPDCRQEGVRLWSFVQSTGWEGTFRFSTDDATDVLGTGSLFLSPENGTMAIQGPCYAVVPGERYLLAAMIRTSGQGSATLLGMNLYSDSTCQTGVGSGAYPGTNTTSWRTIGGFFDAVPFEGDAIVSAIRPTVRVDFPLATQTAQVDNVVIIPDQ